MQKLQSLRQSSDQDRSKLEKRFKDRLKQMDVKMKELHRKEKQFCQLERLKARSEETCARLNSDIVSIKQQKVGCQSMHDPNACICRFVLDNVFTETTAPCKDVYLCGHQHSMQHTWHLCLQLSVSALAPICPKNV